MGLIGPSLLVYDWAKRRPPSSLFCQPHYVESEKSFHNMLYHEKVTDAPDLIRKHHALLEFCTDEASKYDLAVACEF